MLNRSLSLLRKTQVRKPIHISEETSYRIKTTSEGGRVVGITTRSSWHDDKAGRGEEIEVLAAETDSHGHLIQGGEMKFSKKGKDENLESHGSVDPREILKSFNLAIPKELGGRKFQVKEDTPITSESMDKLKSK